MLFGGLIQYFPVQIPAVASCHMWNRMETPAPWWKGPLWSELSQFISHPCFTASSPPSVMTEHTHLEHCGLSAFSLPSKPEPPTPDLHLAGFLGHWVFYNYLILKSSVSVYSVSSRCISLSNLSLTEIIIRTYIFLTFLYQCVWLPWG